ncbi:tRNA (guanosine(37)-N1)-methyltransferase TrmD [Erysipelothrix sp. HDW6C]|uniref:tRNA (guanosine(37)-N1)-methyltransferase TrmD n=1 Tax=Erysipelothrix sp. HDW6C TaxID=2714930 RepID=UPI00140BE5B1|nr:tRNA (guanosine(37)-N1)-methyltransferase TrmD [Erysipelothrix sp. HDW6C]QIK69968.1 tRNA (guanosine(37)-N1)-methyltransferase TrmD [Erysipelothrix sp. HDW6C]
MKISVLTLFPEIFTGFQETSIIKKAILKGLVDYEVIDMRSFTEDKHNRVDDYPYGGGAGLVLMCQPVIDAIKATRTESSVVVMLTPQGRTLKQSIAYELSTYDHLILLCGHYEGFDERIRHYVDMEMSIGDYVLTGGETAAMVISDAVIRLVDGVITKESHEDDSFSNGLLEYPHYTRPRDYEGLVVPDVLISGHHENVRTFRLKESLRKTKRVRPDLLESREMTDLEIKLLHEIENE